MAPPTVPTHAIDRTPEYEDFIAKLQEYHEKRGTNLEAEPKVGHVNVDLLQLFKLINENGGYDKISQEKLAWRNMSNALGLYSTNEASIAYSLKGAYYRNLAAYEISTIHKKEPPPPEILEHVSAKGGMLLTRTMENFAPKSQRATGSMGAEPSGGSGDDATPVRERRPDGTPASARASRGLREAPPQRVIFQPDTAPSTGRQTRHSSGQTPQSGASSSASHPQPQLHGHNQMHGGPGQHMPMPQQHSNRGASLMYNPNNSDQFSALVQAYEPRGPIPLHLLPVATPGNSPQKFMKPRQRHQVPGAASGQLPPRPLMIPGDFSGPNIYVRCLASLRSGIPSEEAFALNHLTKISYERGDKYKFDSFPGLAEGLVEKALQVGSLFYAVEWTISYDPEIDEDNIGELDGVNGTDDILERIANLTPKNVHDTVQPAGFQDQLSMITEAALTIRNMVTLTENANYMADFYPVRDLVCIVLNLPSNDSLVELKHCALDIAEQITPWLALDAEDPLYQTLLTQLNSDDRGVILTALRAIGRISSARNEMSKLGNVPDSILLNVVNWLLLNDDELMDACLDMLYQYTAVHANVENLLKSINVEDLVRHLVRLLSHGARRVHRELLLEPEKKIPAGDNVVAPPPDLMQTLGGLQEPQRCYKWLQCFFEEDPDASITQIAIWQAYQNAFTPIVQQTNRPMLGAAEFIRNVTHVYKSAHAQILRSGEGAPKFVINGLRARVCPVTPEGREYVPCRWMTTPGQPKEKCQGFFIDREIMYNHIANKHLGVSVNDARKYPDTEGEYRCRWAGCRKYQQPTKMNFYIFMAHIKTHVIATLNANEQRPANGDGSSSSGGHLKKPARTYMVPAKTMSISYEETHSTRDERMPNSPPQAAGIPLSALLVLRNLARNVIKTDSEEELQKQAEAGGEEGGWNERLFRPVLPRLFEVMTENKILAPHMTQLVQLIRDN